MAGGNFNCIDLQKNAKVCAPEIQWQAICYAIDGDESCKHKGYQRLTIAADCGRTVDLFEDDKITPLPANAAKVTCNEVIELGCETLTAMTSAVINVDNIEFDLTGLAQAIADAIEAKTLTVDPGAAFEAMIAGLGSDVTAAIQAQTTTLQAELQAICDKLDAGITVNAIQSGTWAVTVDPAQIQALIDGIVNGLDGLEVNLSPANIADLIAAFEAATLTVTGDVNVTGGNITVDGDVGLTAAAIADLVAALEAADLTVTVDGGTITVDGSVDIANIPALVAALDSLNVSIDNIPDLVAALEAANLNVTVANPGGPVDVNGWQDLLNAVQSVVNTITAGIDVNSLPAVTLTAQTIADLVAAMEAATFTVQIAGQPVDVNITNNPLTVELGAATLAALENITVTVDTSGGPVQVAGDVNITNNPLVVEFDYAALAAALDSMNVTVDNLADIEGLSLTVGNEVQVLLNAAQLQQLLERDQTDDDVRVVENYVQEYCLNNQPIFSVIKSTFSGDPENVVADSRVLQGFWHAGAFSAALPAGAVAGACASAADKQAIVLPAACLSVDGVAMRGTAVLKYDPTADAYEAPDYFDGAGMPIAGTVTLNDDPCACEAECVVAIPETPGIQLVKVVDSVEPYAVGDDITGHFVVTNTGNVPLSNVTIVDADPAVTVTGSPIAGLGVGETNSLVTWSYTLTAADLMAGSYQNQATATGSSPSGVQVSDLSSTETNPTGDDPTVVTLEQPAIQIVKEVTSTGPYALGDTISGTFSVTNIGDVILSNVTVTDLNATVTGGTIGTLVVGETNSTATWSHVVTQPDLDLGEYQNQATAQGTSPAGTVVSDLSSVAANPTGDDVNVVDIAQTLDASLLKEGSYDSATGEITYTFTLTNAGNVTISAAPLTDPVIGLSGAALFTLPLAPGASTSATHVYTPTQAELDAGEVENTAVAAIQGAGLGPIDVDSTNVVNGTPDTPTVTLVPNIQNAVVETSSCGPEIIGVTAETVGCIPAAPGNLPAGSDPSNLIGEMRNSLTNQTSGDSLTPGSTYGFGLGITNTDAAPFVGPYLLRFTASCPEVSFTGNVSNAPAGSTITLINAQTLELSIPTDIAPGGPPPGLLIGAPGPEWVLSAGAVPGSACTIQATVNGSPLSGSANYSFTVAGGVPGGGGGGGAGDPGDPGGGGFFFPDSDGDGVEDPYDADPLDPAIQ